MGAFRCLINTSQAGHRPAHRERGLRPRVPPPRCKWRSLCAGWRACGGGRACGAGSRAQAPFAAR